MKLKLADYSQRAVSIGLFGLTVYGIFLLSKGGVRAWKRKKERKIEGQTTN